MDFGRLFLKMGDKEKALLNFSKAFDAYEEGSLERNNASVANAALQIAVIREAKHEFKEALPYARRATDVYLTLYRIASEVYISSLWVTVRILYGISPNDIVHL
jgi:tetratricopeptide (TPR) repeat protein